MPVGRMPMMIALIRPDLTASSWPTGDPAGSKGPLWRDLETAARQEELHGQSRDQEFRFY